MTIRAELHAEAIGQRVRQWAASEPLVRRVYLFGSRVRGQERADSDLDLAVVYHLPEDRSVRLATWIDNAPRWQSSLAAIFPVAVHLVSGHPSDRVVWQSLKREGVRLYPIASRRPGRLSPQSEKSG